MAGEFSVLGVGLPASFFAFLEFLNIIEHIKVIKQINIKKLDFSQEECVLRVSAGPPHLPLTGALRFSPRDKNSEHSKVSPE